jgi:hypothetical protein
MAGTSGELTWSLTLVAPPPNDRFAARRVISGSFLTVAGTALAATREAAEPEITPDPVGGTVWFAWRAPVSGMVSLAVNGPFGLGVHVGTNVAELLAAAAGGNEILFYAAAGVDYAIMIDDAAGLARDFMLTLKSVTLPPAFEATSVQARDGKGFRVLITGTNGQSVMVQASTNLIDWTTVAIDTMQGGSMSWVDPDAPRWPQRFYRVLPLEALFLSPLHVAVGPGSPGSGFPVRVIGPSGQPFTLQTSEDLLSWRDFTRALLTGEHLDFSDGDLANRTRRFYRAVPLR